MDFIAVFISTLQISKITECAVYKIADNEFSGETLVLFHDHEGAVIAEKIGKIFSQPVIMYSTDITFNYEEKADMVPARNIIWIPKIKDFDKQIKNVRHNMWWKSSSKLLIIINEKLKLEELFLELWRKSRSSNVVVMNEDLELYSWIPYEKSTCNEQITPMFLSKCGEVKQPLFVNRIPDDFNNCSFNVTTKQVWPFVGPVSETTPPRDGLEIEIINAISQKLKIHLRYVLIPDDVSFYPNYDGDVLTGAAEKLDNYETDIAFGSMFQTSQHSAYAETLKIPHSIPHNH